MMNRRSWLRGVSQFIKGDEAEGYFFGMQLLIHAFGKDDLRARLATVISDPDGALETTEAKRRYIKRIVSVLLDEQAYWSQAFWDYKQTREEAEAEFEAWSAEISATTATEGEEFGVTIDTSQRLSHTKDYVAVTIIFNLNAPFPPAEIKDETKFWETRTIASLVQGLLLVNPETILADGVFIVPGSPDDGLSEEDLLTGGWSYLRVLV